MTMVISIIVMVIVVVIIVVIGVKGQGVPAAEAGGGAARCEEDLVSGLADVVAVYAVEVAKGPHEVGVVGSEWAEVGGPGHGVRPRERLTTGVVAHGGGRAAAGDSCGGDLGCFCVCVSVFVCVSLSLSLALSVVRYPTKESDERWWALKAETQRE